MNLVITDEERFALLSEEAVRQRALLEPIIARVSALRRKGAKNGLTDQIREALEVASSEAEPIQKELKRIEKEMIEISGIPEELIELIEAAQISDPVDRTSRASVAGNQVGPTALLDDIVPECLDRLLDLVDPEWLRSEAEKGYRLGREFLQAPLVLIRGCRAESEVRPIHRFAQTLLVAKDFVQRDSYYDMFAGALLVPQLAALGLALPYLSTIGGEVGDRLSALVRNAGDSADATVYELLVAASCARAGRDVEFLTAAKKPTGEKTPDFRVHGYPFPVVVECKRRKAMLNTDLAEAERMKQLLACLRSACQHRGLWGVFEFRFSVPPEEVPIQEVVEAALRQPYARDPLEYLEYGWGKLAFRGTSSRVFVPDTPLYSPLFLQSVFGWNTDLPPHDGIACQVRATDERVVSEAREPLAVFWSNDDPNVFRRRARTAASLFKSALDQVGAGEVGIVYICYQEGDREKVADARTQYMAERLHEWAHQWTIQVPISVLTRIVPRPLGDGTPDLIETGLQYVSGVYGDPAWFQDFPTTVFTP
jgi:hypothetical protein